MKTPTEADIEAAKDYLRQRLDAEYSMIYNLESVMREAAKRVVEILYSANIHPDLVAYGDLPMRVQWDIDAVVEWLREMIDDYFVTLAIADHDENREAILPFILGENHGMTLNERLSDYCGKYRDELLLLVGAGIFLDVAKSTLIKSIGDNLKHPYANDLLAEGIDSPLTYGRGRTNSMFTALGDLTKFGIAQGWMKNQYINDLKNGCLGWWVRRGSSYPCELCDSYVGFHIDESELPPYHGHCCCFAVPIYSK